MSLTARNKSIGNYSLRSESHEGKGYSTTRNTYLNAECYESREKELLDRMALTRYKYTRE